MTVPFDGQAAKWADDYKIRREKCINEADMILVISHEYTKNCLYARNRYMVQQADLLLACYDGQEGGTKHTVEYAKW